MGALLKISAHGRVPSGQPQRADVESLPVRIIRVALFRLQVCPDAIPGGQGSLASNENRGPVRAAALGTPQAKWRIGCRRAHVSSWFWPWFLQWPLAPRRKKWLRSLSSSKLLTPARCKNSARACQHLPIRPVAPLDHGCVTAAGIFPKIAATCLRGLSTLRALLPLRPAACHKRSQARC